MMVGEEKGVNSDVFSSGEVNLVAEEEGGEG